MNAAIGLNGTFSEQTRISAPNLAARFLPIQPSARGCQSVSAALRGRESSDVAAEDVSEVAEQIRKTSSDRLYAWSKAVGLILAILVVIGLGVLAGWAVVLVFKPLIQAQALTVQNGFVFQR
jgi:hypothetical protein